MTSKSTGSSIAGKGTLLGVQEGDTDAIAKVFKRSEDRLRRLLHAVIGEHRTFDPEDVLQDLFLTTYDNPGKLLGNVESGKHIWNRIAQKAVWASKDVLKKENAQKRGKGRVRGETAFEKCDQKDGHDTRRGIAEFAVTTDDPAQVLMNKEFLNSFLESFPDDKVRLIAILHMRGVENVRIAEIVEMSERSIRRYISVISKKIDVFFKDSIT